jgi:hypothetical protein
VLSRATGFTPRTGDSSPDGSVHVVIPVLGQTGLLRPSGAVLSSVRQGPKLASRSRGTGAQMFIAVLITAAASPRYPELQRFRPHRRILIVLNTALILSSTNAGNTEVCGSFYQSRVPICSLLPRASLNELRGTKQLGVQ